MLQIAAKDMLVFALKLLAKCLLLFALAAASMSLFAKYKSRLLGRVLW